MRIVGGLEALPEAGAGRAVVDGAADLAQQVGAEDTVVVFWGHAGTVMAEGAWLDGEWDEDEGVWLVGRHGVEGDGVEEWRLAEFWHHFPDELGEAAKRRAACASVR